MCIRDSKKGGCSPRRPLWESVHGAIPEKRHVYTTCGLKLCMNPKHFTLMPIGDTEPRFWKHVKRAQGDGCWIWTADKMTSQQKRRTQRGAGYGNFMINGCTKRVFAHRFSWELHFGPIPPGMLVCHRCDNPSCVRPDHLFLGTHKDNTQDMIRKGRHAHGPSLGAAVRAGHARRKARMSG